MRDGSVSVEQGKRKGWKIILLLQLEISRISDGLDKEVLGCWGLFSYLLGKTAWRSTGLYLPEGHTAVITCPCLVVGAGLKVSSLCLALVYTHVLPCGHPLFSVFMWKSRGWLQCKGAICIHKEAGLNSVMHIKQRMSMHWLVMSTCSPHPVFYLSYYYVFGLKTLVLKQEALIKSYFCVAKKCSKIALVSDVPIQWSGRAFID